MTAFFVGGRGQLWLPLHVEPVATEGVDHGRQRRAELAPAGQRTQADAVLVRGRLVQLGRERRDLIPGRVQRHRQAGGLEERLVVVRHRALAVERQRVQTDSDTTGPGRTLGITSFRSYAFAADAPSFAKYGASDDQPLVLRPDRHVVRTHRRDVELPTAGRHVRRHLLPQRVLRQRHVLDVDPRTSS